MRVSARGLRPRPSGSAAFSWLLRGPAASMPSPACFGFPVAWSPWSALGNPARTPSHGCLPAWMPQCFVACCVRSTTSSSVTSCSRSSGLCVSRPSMGMSFFPSRKRCCPQCCQRRLTVNGEEVIEYYHAGVVCYRTPENASQSGSTAMAVGRRAKRPANGTGQPRSPHRGCPSRPFGKLLTPDGRSRTICSTTCPRTGRSTTATPMNRRPS